MINRRRNVQRHTDKKCRIKVQLKINFLLPKLYAILINNARFDQHCLTLTMQYKLAHWSEPVKCYEEFICKLYYYVCITGCQKSKWTERCLIHLVSFVLKCHYSLLEQFERKSQTRRQMFFLISLRIIRLAVTSKAWLMAVLNTNSKVFSSCVIVCS